jgi:hypothetical protein
MATEVSSPPEYANTILGMTLSFLYEEPTLRLFGYDRL